MADVSKTNRSINSRDTNRLFALQTSQDSRSPHVLKLQGAESVVEGQDAKVGKYSLMGEGIGCEVRRRGNFGAFADNLSHSRESRHDAITCPMAMAALASRASSQKPIACPSKVLVAALTKTPLLSPTSNNGRILIGDMMRTALSRQPADTCRPTTTKAAESAPCTVVRSCRAQCLRRAVEPRGRRRPFTTGRASSNGR
jgi:hypothetical protein